SVGGIALPGRCDEVIRVAVVRRCRRRTASFGAVALSLFVLGLIDSAAMTPLAAVALAAVHLGGWMQLGLAVVVAAGVAAAGEVFGVGRGVHGEEAIAFGSAAQALVIAAGTMFVLALGAWHAQARFSAGGRRLAGA